MARTIKKTVATIVAVVAVGALLASCRTPIVLAACAGRIISSSPGSLQDPALNEISGIADSALNPGTLWANNDSGDAARLFAITDTGAPRRSYTLTGASAVDWEDLALEVGPTVGVWYLYAADIGDNAGTRSSVAVYRVPEPVVSNGPSTPLGGVDRLNLQYPDGAKDAEAMFVDPWTGEIYIIQKAVNGGPVGVYRAPRNLPAGSTTVMTRVMTLALPGGAANSVTAADISTDGKSIAIRTYGGVRLWSRLPTQTVASALSTTDCRGPIPAESQGETIGFRINGRAYFTVSEGSGAVLHRYDAPPNF